MNKGKTHYVFSQTEQVKVVLFHKHYESQEKCSSEVLSCPAPIEVRELTEGKELDLRKEATRVDPSAWKTLQWWGKGAQAHSTSSWHTHCAHSAAGGHPSCTESTPATSAPTEILYRNPQCFHLHTLHCWGRIVCVGDVGAAGL